jgi:dipeptidyl aminopeptidase/acylaminoacyl peptidase
LCWLESLTEDGGRLALKQLTPAGERCITPAGFQIRSRVHEYGGKCFCMVGDAVVFNNFADGVIYRQNLHDDSPPVALTNVRRLSSSFADLVYSEALNSILAIEEIQSDSDGANRNQLVSIPMHHPHSVSPQILAHGADFYAAPCIAPSGQQIAWLQWNLPDMPWDSTQLISAKVSMKAGETVLEPSRKIAGGADISVCQPGFLLNGDLVFAMDQSVVEQSADEPTGEIFLNLYLASDGSIRPLSQDIAEYGEAHWVFGQQRWVQTGPSHLLAVATQNETDQLFEIDIMRGNSQPVSGVYARLSQLTGIKDRVLGVAEYTDRPTEIVEFKSGEAHTLKYNAPWLAADEVSQPQMVVYPTRDGAVAYANYYPSLTTDANERSALLVLVHGGPTSRSSMALSPLHQYFSQNGFAVLDINHRGSTGHGRVYRQALLGRWGEIDASDIADAIQYTVAERGIDPGRVFIRGGSAGGYAVLRALTRFPEMFSGGACYYGIGNLITLSEITHKFEGRYTDQLIGETYTPESANLPESRVRSRSPIFEIDRIKSPLILFQGLGDKVVPPAVSREMVETLKNNGVVHEYIEYPGEGHGFRQAKTKIDALSREIEFYRTILSEMPL